MDLESLGLVLLNCMEEGDRRPRTAQQVRDDRAINKVFGLANAERWSGYKQLVDFLEDIFTGSRVPQLKLERPVGSDHRCTSISRIAKCSKHDFIRQEPAPKGLFREFAEVASFECFTLWRAAKQGSKKCGESSEIDTA